MKFIFLGIRISKNNYINFLILILKVKYINLHNLNLIRNNHFNYQFIVKRGMSYRLDNTDVVICFCFLVVSITIMIVIINMQFIFSIIKFLAYYWVITVPVIIFAVISEMFYSSQKELKKRFASLNTKENRDGFEADTGLNPFNEKGKYVRKYKSFMKKQIPKLKSKYSVPIKLNDLTGFVIVILILIGTTWLTLYIYSLIFVDFRINFWEAEIGF